MTCKDCVHYEVCGKGVDGAMDCDQMTFESRCPRVEFDCPHYKPKSRFVELPCDFCKIIVTGTADNPYYQLLYYNNKVKDWCIGYSSYDLANVFRWKQELEEAENALKEREME